MNQTPELIFRKTNFVAVKHMITFSFPKNSISEKQNIFRKYFYTNQTQPYISSVCTDIYRSWCVQQALPVLKDLNWFLISFVQMMHVECAPFSIRLAYFSPTAFITVRVASMTINYSPKKKKKKKSYAGVTNHNQIRAEMVFF